MKMENEQVQQEDCQIIKPEIKETLLLLTALILAVALSFVLVPLVGAVLAFFDPLIALIGMAAVFVVLWVGLYLIIRITLANTEYKFFDDRIEYYEGFWTKNRKTLRFDRISNVGQRRGVLMRLYGLGAVYVDTPGSSRRGHELTLSSLGNSDEVYNFIVSKINK